MSQKQIITKTLEIPTATGEPLTMEMTKVKKIRDKNSMSAKDHAILGGIGIISFLALSCLFVSSSNIILAFLSIGLCLASCFYALQNASKTSIQNNYI